MAAMLWRLVGAESVALGDLELSAVHLHDAAGTRVDSPAVLTCTVSPVSGTLASLQDADGSSVCRFSAAQVRAAGFALLWQFPGALDVASARVGGAADLGTFVNTLTLESFESGRWVTRGRMGPYAWPGPYSMAAEPPFGQSAPLRTTSQRHRVGAAFEIGPPQMSVGRLLLARDMEFGGRGSITGTVGVKGTAPAPDVLGRHRVRLLRQRDAALARETWSDAATGAFAFHGLDAAQAFIALAEDKDGVYAPVAADRRLPEVPA